MNSFFILYMNNNIKRAIEQKNKQKKVQGKLIDSILHNI